MQETTPTIVVLGAGLTGLVAAHRLRERLGPDAEIIIADPADEPGGKLRSVMMESGPVEVGAEAYLAFRADATEYFEQLGLADQLVEPSGLPSTVYSAGGTHPMPRDTVMGIPASSEAVGDLVSDEGRSLIDAEVHTSFTWTPGEDRLLGELVAERMGREVVDRVVTPLFGGVYSTRADHLGIRATVPQLAHALDALAADGADVTLTGAVERVLSERREANEARVASTGGVKVPVFRTFRDGYAVLIDALLERTEPDLRMGTETGRIVPRNAGGFHVPGVGDADAVVVATPAPYAAELLELVARDAAGIIGNVDLASSAVVAMRFDDDAGLPENSGVLVAVDGGLSAKAFTFSSRKWPHLGERGGAIVRASFGRFGDDSLVQLSDEELIDLAVTDLATATGFSTPPAETYVQRWWGGLPRYDAGHAEAMDAVDGLMDEVTGIAAAGAWHRGPGVPACITDARRAADTVADALFD
ncbi:protoporphyrinogen oxidase [Corynebacterium sputi]|uniref:protoporphyrinogen oxidase n=1 Tax=Corynebacterium sputi TaxID=489915 RepID=UPI0004171BED|nr:protoporphyrinogen oxidase [Corynebacterium sputi]